MREAHPRLCLFAIGGEARLGFGHRNRIADLVRAYALSLPLPPERALQESRRVAPADMEEFITDPVASRRILDRAMTAPHARRPRRFDGWLVLFDPGAVRLLPPVRSRRVLCIARHYAAHGREFERVLKMRRDESTLFAFLKPHTAVRGPFEPVAVPRTVQKLDYEIELAVVIGTAGKNIPRARAHVAGTP